MHYIQSTLPQCYINNVCCLGVLSISGTAVQKQCEFVIWWCILSMLLQCYLNNVSVQIRFIFCQLCYNAM
uniref:Uncharacterized protein n=1 Tax=Anguilla anguilla TaxID=7936 RepID=A0A0E9XGA5_ANGAN